MKQLMNASRGRLKVNKASTVNIDLENREKILPIDQSEVSVNLYNVYMDEREKSDKYRLLFSIYPVCTNVLHNANTEIVRDEGSPNVCVLGKNPIDISKYCEHTPFNTSYGSLTREAAIRDTEYSHPKLGHFVYHCGKDIFNNHTFRQNDAMALQKGMATPYFNTLGDIARDSSQDSLSESIFDGENKTIEMHRYNHDNTLSYFDALKENLIERDGWFGFINQSSMPIEMGESGSGIYINKRMNNNKPCEFYDMYPDRELYSFIPKINPHRNGREEKNWDYCLTYPARMHYTYNKCNYLYDETTNIHGILCSKAIEKSKSIYIQTIIRHGLSINDEVVIYFSYDGVSYENIHTYVTGVGSYDNSDKKHWFSISLIDVSGLWLSEDIGKIVIPGKMRVAKYTDGYTHDYYFREFRKIPNINTLSKQLLDDDILSDDDIATANTRRPFKSVIGKMGFARTIYGDMVSQLIYNDDIDVKHILDHRGRPISEIFLTIIKRNAGYNEWYNGNPGSDSVEYSHCFGKLSAGLDISLNSVDDNPMLRGYTLNYNVHTIHNVDIANPQIVSLGLPRSGSKLMDNITINDEYFLGDIVDWSPYDLSEVVLETVQFRFNTYQREDVGGDEYIGIKYDALLYDDLDYLLGEDFAIKEKNAYPDNCRGNVFPEGYYYNPHYRIRLREYSDIIETYSDTLISYYKCDRNDVDEYRITTSINYPIDINDTLRIRLGNVLYYGIIVSMDNQREFVLKIDNALCIKINQMNYNPLITGDIEIYTPNVELPIGAQYMPNSNGLYHYKAFKTYYDSTDERLKNATFTNDALYLENEIMFFLRRQDPFGKYRLNHKFNENAGVLGDLSVMGDEVDTESEEYVEEKDMMECR